MASAKTPAQLGFRMPAEWEPHEATWIAWPHNHSDWPGKFPAIPWVYGEIVRNLAAAEHVYILVNDRDHRDAATKVLTSAHALSDNIEFLLWPTDRVWLRDSGPIFVRNGRGEVALMDWRFNAWAKYPNWKLDDQIPRRAEKLLKLPRFGVTTEVDGRPRRVVLEGGSIDVNGAGLMLTTEECQLSDVQQRNPGLSREQLERVFADYLGIEQVIWLGRGIAGDDTHGHVDDIARFVAPLHVVTAWQSDARDLDHSPLADNEGRLKNFRTRAGKQLEITRLPMPKPVWFKKQRLPASYANFYICNGRVLVPTFNDANDRRALNILAKCFPEREIIGINCTDFIWGLGAIHCMTQQQPSATSR